MISITIAGYFAYVQAVDNIYTETHQSLKHESDLVEQSLYGLLNEVRNDVGVMANSPALHNFRKGEFSRKGIEGLFKSLLDHKSNYFQIRLIGVEENGKELVRLDRDMGKITTKLEHELQEKGSRDYYKSTAKLNEGEIYFSEIDLNKEHGVVSVPHTPTIRAATPIRDENGKLSAVVIINVKLNSFFNKLRSFVSNHNQLYIYDNSEQFLLHPDQSKQFANQLEHEFKFENEFVSKKEKLNAVSTVFMNSSNKHLISYEKVMRRFNSNQQLSLLVLSPLEGVLENAQDIRWDIALKTSIIILLFLLATFVFSRFFANRISRITAAISAFANNKSLNVSLPANRNDELDLLTSSFIKMKATIDEKVQELEKSLTETKKAKKDRDDFLQNMSHELRTPLNTISGMTQLLKRNEKNERNLPIIDALERSTKNLSGLVYDILDHKKLVEGNLKLAPQPVVLDDLFKSCVSIYQFEAVSKKLTIELDISPDLKNKYVLLDPLRFEQIISNLLINAIKFTEIGSVGITVSTVDTMLQIEVADTGEGMNAEQVQLLNALNATQQKFSDFSTNSFGLGLNIVVDLIKLHNGTLSVKSIPKQGTTFTIQIPLSFTELQSEIGNKSPLKFQFTESFSILQIEDDATNQLLVSEILKGDYISVEHIDSINGALKLLETKKFNLIISDLNLKEGLIIEQLQSIKNKYQIPLIILSASELPTESASKFDAALLKPFESFDLQSLIFYCLKPAEYKFPRFESTYIDYDHDRLKVKKVFTILQSEFNQYYHRVFEAFKLENEKKWEAIQHKLVAHVKKLELLDLIDTTQTPLSKLNTRKREKILSALAFYLACIRAEMLINLKD